MRADTFVELNRTFRQLKESEKASDTESFSPAGDGDSIGWDRLSQEYRVVILSEAGSGKTIEIRNRARVLAGKGLPSFFIRLEHVAQCFEGAFEEGDSESFAQWLKSGDEGWLFLDSVDESRLSSPAAFEAAIRVLSSRLKRVQDRIHIVITGRMSAWRPKADLVLCEAQLPCAMLKENEKTNDGVFKIYSLEDLKPDQIEVFAIEKGVKDVKRFRDDIERADALTFTARPKDLEGLIDFWRIHNRIGNRLELMRNSIERRLREWDPNRDEAWPLSMERAREGAMQIAVACTLTREQVIRVPGSEAVGPGLAVNEILPGWDARECAALLARPIFDEAIYGTVRFHHRSVREYLAAEWFAKLLEQQTSRRRIEALFFRSQYGLEVVAPTLRPVLSWLCVLDSRIAEHVSQVAPEIFFEGGDPSCLPLNIRRRTLRRVCEQMAVGMVNRTASENEAVQRFASVELAADIRCLLRQYESNSDLQFFLLRMVWLGRMVEALPETIEIAASPVAEKYARLVAVRAVMALGTSEEKGQLRAQFLAESKYLSREWMTAFVDDVEISLEVVDWVFDCLRKIEGKVPHSVDQIAWSLSEFAGRMDTELLIVFVERVNQLLVQPPYIEDRFCMVSKRYAWLTKAADASLTRLLKARHPASMCHASLSILHKLPVARKFYSDDIPWFDSQLGALVGQWDELRYALFWYCVDHERAVRKQRGEFPLNHWWSGGAADSLVSFVGEDFGFAVKEILMRPSVDDKMVALSLAFRLWEDSGCLDGQFQQLKNAIDGDDVLSDTLSRWMSPRPLSEEEIAFQKQEAIWKSESEQRRMERERERVELKRCVLENIEKLRSNAGSYSAEIFHALRHLYWCMHKESEKSHNKVVGNWRLLAIDFGEDVARAFRDGVVAYWRTYEPQLMSEGASLTSGPFADILGLCGIAIEAREVPDWSSGLTEDSACCAFRYAMRELNGFPVWLPDVYERFSDVVLDMVLKEIDFELMTECEDKDGHYLLYDVSVHGEWLWNAVAPSLLEKLTVYEPINLRNLEFILNIIQGSTVSDEKIAQLCVRKVDEVVRLEHVARWFAVWTGVAPDQALMSLGKYVDAFSTKTEKVDFAIAYAAQLLGGRVVNRSRVRENYKTAPCLKSIYLLMLHCVSPQDDINRGNGVVYSPGLRDDAQDARDHLLALLVSLPGKEAFIAVNEISCVHPNEQTRAWIKLQAKGKAERDADFVPWTVDQVQDFAGKLERTPANHRELFELAVLQLEDLKDDWENGDNSIAEVLQLVDREVKVRNIIGEHCRKQAHGRYHVAQEEEMADAKRTDLRWLGMGFDAPVPVELKLADKWPGSDLFERLENQLCGDYLRDQRSTHGIFLLVNRGKERQSWQLPGGAGLVGFEELVRVLQRHWDTISPKFPKVDDIRVIGIDLTKRFKSLVH